MPNGSRPEHEALGAAVPERERVHAAEPRQRRRAPLHERCEQHLGVAGRAEAVAARFKLRRAARGSCRSRR